MTAHMGQNTRLGVLSQMRQPSPFASRHFESRPVSELIKRLGDHRKATLRALRVKPVLARNRKPLRGWPARTMPRCRCTGARRLIAEVLEEKVSARYFRIADGRRLAVRVLRQDARRFFRLQGSHEP